MSSAVVRPSMGCHTGTSPKVELVEKCDDAVDERLQIIHSAGPLAVDYLASVIPPSKLPVLWLGTLNSGNLNFCLRACLIVLEVTKSSQVPRKIQLEAALAAYHNTDSLLAAGTGSSGRKMTSIPNTEFIQLQSMKIHSNDFWTVRLEYG